MEVLTSNWSNVQTLPDNYIFPPDRRPGTKKILSSKDIPIINLERINGPERDQIIQQIIKSSEDFGLFQVINHGVSRDLTDQTMAVFKEFFASPAELKAKFYSNDLNSSCRLYTSTLNYENEEVHYWRDNFTHRCHPLEDHIKHWPEKPVNYREVVGKYSIEVRRFLMKILGLICDGMGLETGYLEGEMSKNQLISVNHHIPCPDPSLTLGMPEHSDPNLISMIQQGDICGLQALKDGQWIGIEPIPGAFVVIPGLQLRVISNGKLASIVHRVVTDSKESRTTIGTFLTPSNDILIKPADGLLGSMAPMYRGYTYEEFFSIFIGNNCVAERALECLKL
ncbi:oxoglutarate/iron-dependent dioxygenase [Artemisia annua]|uniref:Oxoglutarate/iron-dependent dioxygenase n=1 Tax=Artemisia annua TaxID=35608 RepID=A0A2U1NHC5_ARTAN|nr:oxoglutarate/iron-dependent dioxygenase [Artemisia annua]